MPGSIHDISTMDESLERLDLVDAKRLHMAMDKGVYIEDNVDAMYKRHMGFLVGVRFTTSLSLDTVECHRNDEIHRKNSVGWFVLATNDVKAPVKALEIYWMKEQ